LLLANITSQVDNKAIEKMFDEIMDEDDPDIASMEGKGFLLIIIIFFNFCVCLLNESIVYSFIFGYNFATFYGIEMNF
jgi:hypothetical protein